MKKFLLTILTLFTFKAVSDDQAPNLMQQNIKHVVILMLENRSFDNVLAWLYNQENPPSKIIQNTPNPAPFFGLSDIDLTQYTNIAKDSKGNIIFSTPPIKGIPSVSNSKFLNSPKFDPNEEFPHVINQIGLTNGGEPTMLGFLQDYASIWEEDDWEAYQKDIFSVMETYTEKELPVTYGLARHYAISDYWFCSIPTQTNPNRGYSICGTSEGAIINDTLGTKFNSDTIWNRLTKESPDTTWTIFWEVEVPGVTTNNGPFTGPYTFKALNKINNLQSHLSSIDSFHDLARKGQLPNISYVEPQWTYSYNISPTEKEFLALTSEDDFIMGFQGNDMHPPSDMRTAENLLSNIYSSLIANKEAWAQTLFIIYFDEHGGLFDHVPPPAAVAPDHMFHNGFEFDRYGVRVPIIFISPLIEKGTIVRSDNPAIPFDHTSMISTLLKWRKVDKSKWNMGKRVDIAPTFESVITLTEPRQDCVIGFDADPTDNVVRFGDVFCLKNKEGKYLSASRWVNMATVGSNEEKLTLACVNGSGELKHGSFCLFNAPNYTENGLNLLGRQSKLFDCAFSNDHQNPNQWWTIKNVDRPYLGANICYGDKVYIENHVYRDLFQLVPGRLCEHDGLLGKYAVAKPITDNSSEDNYWIIERPD